MDNADFYSKFTIKNNKNKYFMQIKMNKRKNDGEIKKAKKRKIDQVHIEPPENGFKKIYLTENKLSWIELRRVSSCEGGLTFEEFEQLWSEKPSKKASIKLFGKTIECPRYTKNYLTSYKFSGVEHGAEEKLPRVLEKIFQYSKAISPDLNQCLVNFYEANGSIGKHSDNEKQIVKGSQIHSWTFGPASRFFILESKDGLSRFKVNVNHNTLLIMGGKCQETHIHHVPKKKGITHENDERRINVTFREFYSNK